MCARPRRQGGFTVIELVAVVAIIAILAAYAAPLFVSSNTTFSQRGFADELAGSLRLARSVAVATTCDVQVTINAGTYQVLQRAAGAAPAPCQTAGGFVTAVRRSDGNTLSGYPPAGIAVPGSSTFIFLGGTPPNLTNAGSVAGGVAPPATTVGTFTVSVDVDGWVQVQ